MRISLARFDPKEGADLLCRKVPAQFHSAICGDLDVGGLQISMNDPFFVRGLQRFGNLLRYVQAVFNWNCTAFDSLC